MRNIRFESRDWNKNSNDFDAFYDEAIYNDDADVNVGAVVVVVGSVVVVVVDVVAVYGNDLESTNG